MIWQWNINNHHKSPVNFIRDLFYFTFYPVSTIGFDLAQFLSWFQLHEIGSSSFDCWLEFYAELILDDPKRKST